MLKAEMIARHLRQGRADRPDSGLQWPTSYSHVINVRLLFIDLRSVLSLLLLLSLLF